MSSNYTLSLHCYGMELTNKVQQLFSAHEHIMILFSHIGDPRYAFLMLFPLAYCTDNGFGLKVLWLSSLTEWTNAVLKWIARDDRPYWWSSTNCMFAAPMLEQYPITCESGPGFPSGHVMSSSSLGLLILFYLHEKQKRNRVFKFTLILLVPMYIAMVCLVSLSRVFIATHFPHQVIVGAVVGILMAVSVQKLSSNNSRGVLLHQSSLLIACTLLAIALVLFYTLRLCGLNPTSSVDLALQHCFHRHWVHIDTTLFFAVVRDVGSLCGISLAAFVLPSLFGREVLLHSKSWSQIIGSVCLGVLFCLLFSLGEHVRLPQDDIILFYILAALKYAFIVVSVILGDHTFSGLHIFDIDYKIK